MARKRKKAQFNVDQLLNVLKASPAWTGPILAGIVFSMFRWGAPAFAAAQEPGSAARGVMDPLFGTILPGVAPIAGAAILVVWLFAEFHKWSDRRRLDGQSGIESIRTLDWRDFEQLLAEAFRREGYSVELTGGAGADGGVDLRLERGGKKTLVQCKHWKKQKVGVQVIRELLGVVTSEAAHAGAVVTSGQFTPDGEAFAQQSGIRLIDGPLLEEMVRGVQGKTRSPAFVATSNEGRQAASSPNCPQCGAEMVLRMARQGAKPGSQFWGCSAYPRCRGTVPHRA